ncbi:hypothetical protein BD289DRAFT_372634 [Coniella lustricola]|uniref:Uncharacterized protein n=1 Tax=Coniella lustricola TaxID=2025994 RepID=A0A2T3A243_9PEZI|nr:hypothetical protein BD289DRAFT_372634 [Coniella lustricola]
MLVQYSTVLAVMASAAIAAPLNINLGAYSPALVVGDGEISFAGQQAAAAAGAAGTAEAIRQEGGLSKRQSAGFDRALKFAEAALTKGPKIQLGTEAAGVGILVDNNPTPAAAVNQAG